MNVTIPQAQIAEICRRHHIRKLSVFGSILRDDYRAESDVDVLAEFEADFNPGWEIVDLADELGRTFSNRHVDVVNPKYLNRWLRDEILATAQVVYEAEG